MLEESQQKNIFLKKSLGKFQERGQTSADL